MKNFLKLIATLAFIFIIVYGIFYLSTILTYILIAGIFSLLGRPIYNILRRIKIGRFNMPTSLCAVLTLLSYYAIIFGFISLFLPLIIEEVKVISSIKFQDLATSLAKPLTEIDAMLQQYQFGDNKVNATILLQEGITSLFSMSNIPNIFGSVFGTIGSIFAAVFSVTFMTFFFLIDSQKFYNFALMLVPKHLEKSYHHIVRTTQQLLTRYFIGVFIQITLITSLITIGMLVIGVPNALLIGFFAGMINIIPYLGPIIGMVFGLFVAITTGIPELVSYTNLFPFVVKIMSVFLSVQLLDNSLFQPIIFSSSIKAHPLEIFLLVWVAATLAGIGGMVLAIPCYTIVRVIVSEILIETGFIEPPKKEYRIADID
ncbi:MAG: AI-2E family transporter [Chitinophagales bacterium]